MELYEQLYDESERVNVKFVGITTENVRYDFGITYTNMFFGKPLITCMQTGRSFLMCAEDAKDIDHLRKAFKINDLHEAEAISEFLTETLPYTSLEPQYNE